MPKLTYYQQQRADGGVRTAIFTEHETLLHHFEEGSDDTDPTLLWFVELRCEGRRLPAEPEPARQWFLDHAELMRNGLKALAERLEVGMDADWPLLWPMPAAPRGVRVTIAISVARRSVGLKAASILADVADHFEANLRKLRVPQPASL
jgi:hypothetical protein